MSQSQKHPHRLPRESVTTLHLSKGPQLGEFSPEQEGGEKEKWWNTGTPSEVPKADLLLQPSPDGVLIPVGEPQHGQTLDGQGAACFLLTSAFRCSPLFACH